VGSTAFIVDAHGRTIAVDPNPYGVTIVPPGIPASKTPGVLRTGDILVSNIGANDTGTTLVRFSAHGGPGFLFNTAANAGTKGPNAEVFNSLSGNVWVANASGNNVQVFTPGGRVLLTITNSLFHKPWGLAFNNATPNPHDSSVAAFFVTNVADATIDRIDILPGQHAPTFRVSQIGQLTRSGPETKIALTWVRSLRLHGAMYSDVLLAIDGAMNRIAAFPNSSTRNAPTSLPTDKGITAFQGSPLNAPIGLSLNPLNGDLLVVNQNDNNLVELNLSQGKVVGTRLLDNVPVDAQSGNGSALIGVAASTDSTGNLEVFFTDDNTNTLNVLRV
jgi:DNA-binding beta-propeller fold protein YncE